MHETEEYVREESNVRFNMLSFLRSNYNMLRKRKEKFFADRQRRCKFYIFLCIVLIVIIIAVIVLFDIIYFNKQDRESPIPCLTSTITCTNGRTYKTSTVVPETLNDKYAYVAFIYGEYPNIGWAACGGTFVLPNYILTSAHCLDNVLNYFVYSGSIPTEQLNADKALPVDKIITHELYNSTNYENDIGLIKLKKSIKLNGQIKTVPLSIIKSKDLEGKRCEVPGKASLEIEDSIASNVTVKYVTIMNKKDSICNDSSRVFGSSDNQPRAGDSGSGLICDYQEVAILSSYTYNCNASSYIHLSHYYCGWIINHLEPLLC